MPNGERKGLLKQIARAYLPDHIINRPKQGFAIPIGDWFRSDFGGLRQLLHDHLRSADPFPGLADAGVNQHEFVEQMLREHDAAGEASLNPWPLEPDAQRDEVLELVPPGLTRVGVVPILRAENQPDVVVRMIS
jgi:asparagine synthetase B (glutamine-hydrolysing)